MRFVPRTAAAKTRGMGKRKKEPRKWATVLVSGGVAKAVMLVDRLGCETVRADVTGMTHSRVKALADRQAVRMLEIAQQAGELRIASVSSL
jgi:hypothetical protein